MTQPDIEARLLEDSQTAMPNAEAPTGPVATLARTYQPDKTAEAPLNAEKLLGFILNLTYEEVTIVTCDPWKRNCGGVPRNTLVLVRLAPSRVSNAEKPACDRVIMIRITNSVPTPIDSEIKQIIFEMHKSQANIDPITDKEFQWSALKGSVVGTFFDENNGNGTPKIGFGLDVDTYFAPHFYEVYVPTESHLETLINAFSEDLNPLLIGELRYTETPSVNARLSVPIKIDPSDFTGKSYGHRTALFGKTRFGKSNTMKVIADTILESGSAGQIVFDPSGEYTYWNGQDGGCLAARHQSKCVRYSLNPKERTSDKEAGLEPPLSLKVDFYKHPDVGKSLIFSLWENEIGKMPDYVVPAQNWEPVPVSQAPNQNQDRSGYNRYWRTMGIWYAILIEAGFPAPSGEVFVDFQAPVKAKLLENPGLAPSIQDSSGKMKQLHSYQVAANIWKAVADIHDNSEMANKNSLFKASSKTGDPYFDPISLGLLRILHGAGNISGARKFSRFKPYHSTGGTNVFSEVIKDAQSGKTVFLDLAMGEEKVRKAIADRISQSLLISQMSKFNDNSLGDHMVVLYFEEAHTLFPSDDRGLGENIYNKLAKEGAKFNISLVYATQSISTLSPDLGSVPTKSFTFPTCYDSLCIKYHAE